MTVGQHETDFNRVAVATKAGCFHIQYGQPAAFYLKAPTVLYVFIFIALRALSLAPIYVSVYPNAGLPNPLLPTGFGFGTSQIAGLCSSSF